MSSSANILASLQDPNPKNNTAFATGVAAYLKLRSIVRPSANGGMFVDATGTANSAGSGPNGWYSEGDLNNLDPTGAWKTAPLYWVEDDTTKQNAGKGPTVAAMLALLTDPARSAVTRIEDYYEQSGFGTADQAHNAALAIPAVQYALALALGY